MKGKTTMKKRILAVLLACLMIASVLPISVLAELEMCEEHNLDDFTAEEIEAMKVKVVPSVCGEYGYTLYLCPDCDNYFADNFNKIEGNHNWETKTEAKDATCTEGGNKELQICTVCGDTHAEYNGAEIPASGHDYKIDEEASAYDCVEGGKLVEVCANCGDTVESEREGEGHKWSEHPAEITKEPDFVTGETGIAVYECGVCHETKEVVIKADCTHENGLTEHKGVDAACTTDGAIAYWSCADCGKYYADVNATKEVEKDEDGNYITVIEALGHITEGDEIEVVETFPATCTGEGWQKVVCGRCEEEVKVTIEPTGHSFDDDNPTKYPATCTGWGFDVYACTTCGFVKQTNSVEPLGHTDWQSEDSKNVSFKQAADCVTDGLVNWDCGNCGTNLTKELDKTEHTEVTVEVGATCSKYDYVFVYCSNENCPLEAKSEYVEDGVSYDVTVEGAAVKLIRCTVGTTIDENNHNIVDGVVNAPTCTEPGNMIGYCTDCNTYDAILPIDPPGHDFDASIAANVTIKVPQDCENDEVITVKCSRCDETEDQTTDKKALGHNFVETGVVVDPTCIADGYTETECENCGEMGAKDITTFESKFYFSVEAAQKEHVNLDLQSVTTFREGNCLINGYYSYKCDDCGENILVVIEGTGEGHIDDGKYDQEGEIEDTGCGDGEETKGAYICTNCGELIEYYLEHDWDKTEETPADCETMTNGTKALWVCKNAVCGAIHEEYNGGEIVAEHDYEDQDPLNVAPDCENPGYEGHKICKVCGDEVKTDKPALNSGHAKMTATDKLDASCKGDGQYGYQHWECEFCDYEYIDKYVKAPEHVEVDLEAVAPDCENTGLTAGKMCDVCKDITVAQKEVPATGHHNAAGELIECDTEDRFCVAVVGKDEDENDIYCGEVGDTHVLVGPIVVDATCHEYGYDLWVCTNCEWSKIANVDETYLEDHTWGAWVEVPSDEYDDEIMEERECTVCGEKEERTVEEIKIKYVLDIDNAVASGAGYSDSSLVVVKISIEALKEAVDVWGVNFGLDYDETVMSFVEAKFVSENFITNPMANAKDGVVSVLASVPNNENKETTNVTIETSEAFVELYFRIDNAKIDDGATDTISAEFKFVDCEARNNAGDRIGSAGEIEAIEIVKYMDVDGDGDVNMADALMVSKIITGEIDLSYDVSVDVDKDGEITATDLKAICEYIVGSKGYDDMLSLGVDDTAA